MLQTDKTVEGVDGGKSRVSAPDAISTRRFKMIKKTTNERWVEILQRKRGWWLMQRLLRKAQKQAETIAIGLHGPGARVALLNQAFDEETLQKSGKVGGLTFCGHSTTLE
jgi:hypothetical protein